MMYDVVIIGGGHNGLVCSAYLAIAGLKVLVLDQRPSCKDIPTVLRGEWRHNAAPSAGSDVGPTVGIQMPSPWCDFSDAKLPALHFRYCDKALKIFFRASLEAFAAKCEFR